jgi:hypothetical protein
MIWRSRSRGRVKILVALTLFTGMEKQHMVLSFQCLLGMACHP